MSLDTFKRRSALRMKQLAERILDQTGSTPDRLSRAPDPDELQAIYGVQSVGPQRAAAVWAGQTLCLSGAYGEYVLPKSRFDGLVAAGFMSRDGRLTESVKAWLDNPDTYELAAA